MSKRSRLSKRRQELATEYMPLVKMLARYFSAGRPAWQRNNLLPDLEGEGYLALSKAAVTYDRGRLPYPKAYFARAILNAMCKHVRRVTRQPGEEVTMAEAETISPHHDELDHIRLAIESLDERDQDFAVKRFLEDKTLRSLAESESVSLRIASMRNRRLVSQLSRALGIRLGGRDEGE